MWCVSGELFSEPDVPTATEKNRWLGQSMKNITETLITMLTLPFALIGGVWGMYWLGYNWVAVAIGFIALAGLAAAETGITDRSAGVVATQVRLVVRVPHCPLERLRYRTKKYASLELFGDP